MKKHKPLLISLFFLLTIAPVKAVAPRLFSFANSLKGTSPLTDFNNPSFIFAGGTVITEAGTYGLQQDLLFDPTNPGEACIIVEADNVLIDLNLKSISQAPGNTQPNTDGIRIAPNVKNVVIRNGAISNFSGSGVVIQDGAEVIDIFDVAMLDMGVAGILVDGLSTGTQVNNIVINLVSVGGNANVDGSDVYGIWVKNTELISIQDSSFSDCNATGTGNIYNMRFDNCSSVHIQSCLASDSEGLGNEIIGVAINNSDNIIIFDTGASLNSLSTSGTAYGFKFVDSQGIYLEESTAARNTSQGSVYGVYLDGCSFCQINDSQALGNIGDDFSTGVYSNNGSSNQFKGIQSASNNGGIDAYGILLTGTETTSAVTYNTIEANIAITGTGYGVFLGDDVVETTVLKNYISRENGGTAGYGIFDAQEAATTSNYYSNSILQNSTNINFTSPSVSIYSGPLSVTPGPLQNTSL